jgi:Domain of unknown function (DUF1707)
MVEPGDELVPSSPGRSGLRASRADRERVIDLLKAAFVQGRLNKDELDLRVGEAFASRTYAGLHALTADLPAGLADTQPLEPAREPDSKPAGKLDERTAVRMIAAVLVAVPSSAFAVGLMESGTRPELAVATRVLYIILFACMVAMPAAGLVIFHSWLSQHAGRQAPPEPPGTGGGPAERLASGDATGEPQEIRPDARHGTAWAVIRILAGPPFPPAG